MWPWSPLLMELYKPGDRGQLEFYSTRTLQKSFKDSQERFYSTMAVKRYWEVSGWNAKVKRKGWKKGLNIQNVKEMKSTAHRRDWFVKRERSTEQPHTLLSEVHTSHVLYTNWREKWGNTHTQVSHTQSAFPLHLHASTWLLASSEVGVNIYWCVNCSHKRDHTSFAYHLYNTGTRTKKQNGAKQNIFMPRFPVKRILIIISASNIIFVVHI